MTQSNQKIERAALALLAAMTALFIFWNLGGHDLSAPDEPRFALVAREMIQDNHWLLPHRNENPYPDKPPLFFWSIAAMSLLTGGEVTAWTARLPSALAAIAVLFLIFRWAAGEDREGARQRALLTALVLASGVRFFYQARMAQIDMLLCLCVAWAMVQGWRALEGQPYRPWLLGLALGLGILAKGPVGYLIPVGAWCLYAWMQGRETWSRFPRSALLWGLAPVALWLAALAVQVSIANEWDYFYNLVFKQTLVRYVDPWHHYQPFYYFLTVLLYDFQPWVFLLVAAAPFTRAQRAALSDREKFAWAMVVFTLIFFSLSRGKRNLYIVPLYPFTAYLVACRLVWMMRQARASWGQRSIWFLVGAPLIGVGAALAAVPFGAFADQIPDWVATPPPMTAIAAFGGLTALCGLAAVGLGLAGRPAQAAGGAAAAMLSICLLVFGSLLPWLEPYRSARRFMERANPIIAASENQAVAMVQYRSAYRFYGDHPLIELRAYEEMMAKPTLTEHYRNGARTWVIVREHDWQRFLEEVPGAGFEVAFTMRVGRGTPFYLVKLVDSNSEADGQVELE